MKKQHKKTKQSKDVNQPLSLHRRCAVYHPVHVIAPAQLLPLPGSSANDVLDQKNKARTRQQGITAACRANGGPLVLITSYCYGYLHTEGLGPFQTFLIESMKQIK